MNAATALPYAVAAAGVAVCVAWSLRVRAGRDPLGPVPAGSWPDTGLAVLVAVPAWFLLVGALAAVAQSAGLSGFALATVTGIVHAAIGLVLLPFVRRGAPAAPLPPARLAAAGLLAGLATFGLVGLTGEALRAAYALAGSTAPEQDVVAMARQASGWDWAGMLATGVVLAPFGEEIFWRGALLPALMRRCSPGAAIAVQGVMFGAVHVIGAPATTWPLAIPLALVGALCGWAYLRTGSLAVPVVLHAVFNGLNLAFLRMSS